MLDSNDVKEDNMVVAHSHSDRLPMHAPRTGFLPGSSNTACGPVFRFHYDWMSPYRKDRGNE